MKPIYISCLIIALGAFSMNAFCEPGEYWKVARKFTLSDHSSRAAVTKECMPGKASPKDLLTQRLHAMKEGMKKDKGACSEDFKTSGNKTTWQMDCKGNIPNGGEIKFKLRGEMTTTANGYTSVTHNEGAVNSPYYARSFPWLSQSIEATRLGGSCDTKERPKKMK